MSISLTNVQQTEFDMLVKAEYQSQGFLLRDAIRMKREVVGSEVQFRKVGQVVSTATAYMQSVTMQDPNYQPKVATLVKYTAATGVDDIQQLTVNFDTKMENAMLVGAAMGRRSDQIGIDALAADVGHTIPDGSTNFTYAKYTDVIEFFEDNAVPLGDRFVAMSASNFRSLLQADEFTSTFYTQNRVLDKGMIKEYLGFNVIIIPTMVEGGLPKAGDIRTALAWHKMSTGMGIGANFRTEIHYLPRETTWLINGIFSAGAKVIDNKGVLAIECDETA